MRSTRLVVRDPRSAWRLLSLLVLGLLLVSSTAFAQDEGDDEDGETQAKDDGAPKIKDRVKPRTGASGAADALSRATGSGATTTTADGESVDEDDDQAPSPPPPEEEDDEPEPWRGDGDSPAQPDPAQPARRTVEPLPGDVKINIDYDDVEIKAIVKDFAHKTGRNFLVDGKISGKITIHAPRAVSVDEAYEAFIIALDSAGYTTVVEARFKSGPNKGKPMLTRILSAADARTEPLELYRSGRSIPSSAHLITRLVQVENVSADEMSRILQKWVSKDGDIVAYPPSNTLIITDSANNIRRMVELIEELDISAPKQKLEVIEIKFAEAAQVLSIIQEIYGVDATAASSSTSTGSSASSRAAERRRARRAGRSGRGKERGTSGTTAAAGSASATSVGKEGSFVSKMIADERTNSILVLATEKSIEEIKELIAKIDYEVDPFAQADIHVIYLEHAKAEELSSTLNSLIQQSSSGRSRLRAGCPRRRRRPPVRRRRPGGPGRLPRRQLRRRSARHPRRAHQLARHHRQPGRLQPPQAGHRPARHPAQAGVRRDGDHGSQRHPHQRQRRLVARRRPRLRSGGQQPGDDHRRARLGLDQPRGVAAGRVAARGPGARHLR